VVRRPRHMVIQVEDREGTQMKKLQRRVEKFNGLSVGLDLHKTFIQVSVLDRHGDEVHADRLRACPEALGALVDRLLAWPGGGGGVRVALEASGCFVWVYDQLKDRLGGESVRVAAPSKVRAIAQAGEKTDASDAWWLAYLCQEGRLPEAFVAEGDLRDLRIASRELRRAVDERSDLMRRMRSHLAQLGLGFAKSAWASVRGRGQIAELVERVRAEHGMRGEAVERLWGRIERMNQEVAHWDKRVRALSKRFDQVAWLEDQLPGVGPVIAAAVWSELGDPGRYRSAKAYAKATGLTPGYRESGGRRSPGRITREGSAHARWAFTRAVLACTRCTKGPGVRVKRWLEKQSRRKPKKAAMVAAARKLAEGVWRLMKLGEAFDLERAFPA
jgi:transposase